MRSRFVWVALLAASALLGAACGSSGDVRDGDGLVVVASFYPLAEAAQRVGGDLVTVQNLTPPGVEPHDLELAPDDLEAIATADVVLYLGGGFQPAIAGGASPTPRASSVDVLDAAGSPASAEPPARKRMERPRRRIRTSGSTPLGTRGSSRRSRSARRGRDRRTRRRSDRTPRRSMRSSRRWTTSSPTGLATCESRTDRREPRRLRLPRRRRTVSSRIAISGVSPEAEPEPRAAGRAEGARRARRRHDHLHGGPRVARGRARRSPRRPVSRRQSSTRSRA